MKIQSLYITQTAVIGLSDVPLEAKENTRNAFDCIFRNKNCFKDAGVNFINGGKNEMHSNLPFINNMGQLCFNNLSAYYFCAYNNYEYVKFGYDKSLKDERMNFLCFMLSKPFKMLAQYDGKTVASGNIFLHIYPTGYMVVHLAVYSRSVDSIEIKTEEDILDLIHETKPWMDGKWKWKSKFGCYSLRETFEQVFKNISLSLFRKGELRIEKLEWKAGVAMKTDLHEEISKTIMASDCFVDFRTRWKEHPNGILVAKKRIHYYFAQATRERHSILHSFWKINHIYEFVLYKNKVYSDYLKYIRKDRNEMRDLKLNKEYKFKAANIVGKDFYKSTFFKYTLVLDEYVKMLGAKYGALYALFSRIDGFDDKRKKLNRSLEEWENDIIDWNNKDTILSKLFSLLMKVKDIL